MSISVEFLDCLGSDLTVVNAARVSFAMESEEFGSRDKKLVRYLAAHGHWTPFAHVQVQLRIKAPVFVARQLVKHKVTRSIDSWDIVITDDKGDTVTLYCFGDNAVLTAVLTGEGV
jgi:thymidylate synthase ThyX